jgi:hypothetical protein
MTVAGQRCSVAIGTRPIVTRFLASILLLLAMKALSLAQLTIINPKNLDLPQDRARVLLIEASRVVANEFHVRNSSDVGYPLLLVLGEKDEGYGIDSEGRVTLYLQVWSETKFVDAATRLAIQSLANRKRLQRLAKEVLQRSDRIVPVSHGTLLGRDGFLRPGHPTDTKGNCFSAVRDRPCPTTTAGPDNRRKP